MLYVKRYVLEKTKHISVNFHNYYCIVKIYLKVLEGRRGVFAFQTRYFSSNVASKNLTEGVGFLASRVKFCSTDTLKICLFHCFHQIAHEFMCIFLSSMHHVLAN